MGQNEQEDVVSSDAHIDIKKSEDSGKFFYRARRLYGKIYDVNEAIEELDTVERLDNGNQNRFFKFIEFQLQRVGFKGKDITAACVLHVNTHVGGYWADQLGEGSLEPHCKFMLYMICEYQELSPKDGGIKGTPYMFIAEEFKRFLIRLSYMSLFSPDAEEYIAKREDYWLQLLQVCPSSVFSSLLVGLYSYMSMYVKSEIVQARATVDAENFSEGMEEAFDSLRLTLLDFMHKLMTLSSPHRVSGYQLMKILKGETPYLPVKRTDTLFLADLVSLYSKDILESFTSKEIDKHDWVLRDLFDLSDGDKMLIPTASAFSMNQAKIPALMELKLKEQENQEKNDNNDQNGDAAPSLIVDQQGDQHPVSKDEIDVKVSNSEERLNEDESKHDHNDSPKDKFDDKATAVGGQPKVAKKDDRQLAALCMAYYVDAIQNIRETIKNHKAALKVFAEQGVPNIKKLTRKTKQQLEKIKHQLKIWKMRPAFTEFKKSVTEKVLQVDFTTMLLNYIEAATINDCFGSIRKLAVAYGSYGVYFSAKNHFSSFLNETQRILKAISENVRSWQNSFDKALLYEAYNKKQNNWTNNVQHLVDMCPQIQGQISKILSSIYHVDSVLFALGYMSSDRYSFIKPDQSVRPWYETLPNSVSKWLVKHKKAMKDEAYLNDLQAKFKKLLGINEDGKVKADFKGLTSRGVLFLAVWLYLEYAGHADIAELSKRYSMLIQNISRIDKSNQNSEGDDEDNKTTFEDEFKRYVANLKFAMDSGGSELSSTQYQFTLDDKQKSNVHTLHDELSVIYDSAMKKHDDFNEDEKAVFSLIKGSTKKPQAGPQAPQNNDKQKNASSEQAATPKLNTQASSQQKEKKKEAPSYHVFGRSS